MAGNTTKGKFSAKNNHTVEQKITKPQDFIAVAGSALGDWDFGNGDIKQKASAAKRFFRQSPGNRYRFINQAIRALYSFPVSDNKNQRILIVFSYEYTEIDKKRITDYARRASALVIFVDNVDKFISFLNDRKELGREIKIMEIYSHGIIGAIEFHYGSEIIAENSYVHYEEYVNLYAKPAFKKGSFNRTSVDNINLNVFAHDAVITSYACRTGIDGERFAKPEDAKPENSLAQYMANRWGGTVRAFQKRSLYKYTYDPLPNERVSNTFRQERMESIRDREFNEKNGGGPIMPKGAWHSPTSGQTPTGVREGLVEYRPK
ncbi:hypothetical protein [Wielerella bovis]|uniref:hypothetical protein n=1 Tax=Wielerella bovis TaxID=2917790 RepID=UPI00201974B9|nr:hypothetical protein [Wielerella bovis]ULJ59376.1 hypothetical protein MIS44_06600 [Wielerella bovis]